MKAFVIQNGTYEMTDMPEQETGANDVTVKMTYVGLNRRDLYIKNRLGNDPNALILGSDGVGIVEKVGDQVSHIKEGDKVIINPSLAWEKISHAPPASFDILGMPDHGTFAEKLTIDASQVMQKPAHLTDAEAATVALAALTAYRAMFTQGRLQKDETVFIPGGSSGVSQFLIQFAIHSGARVITSSRDLKKRAHLQELGAHLVIDSAADWSEVLANEKIDLVIESVGAATFNRSLAAVKQGGRVVVFGATAGDEVTLNLRDFFYGQYHLIGSTMGSKEELQEALNLMEAHHIKPIIGHEYVFNDLALAMTDLEANKYFGKLTVKVR